MMLLKRVTDKLYDDAISSIVIWATIIFLYLCLFAPWYAYAKPKDIITIPSSFSELAEKAGAAVVNISADKKVSITSGYRKLPRRPFGSDDPFQDFFDKFFGDEPFKERREKSLGSGFIIDSSGYIVTNNHVVENADNIKVKLKNQKEFEAKIIGTDAKTDLAILKVISDQPLPALKFGDSEGLMVGQWVVAIGSPFGLENTVTAGIVSAKGRVIGSGPYDDFIQTDASINPGNSGGPLLNMNGEVVGINTAIIAGGQGIGFAIPVNLAKKIIDQLKTHGSVIRGWLGVGIQSLSQELREYYGIDANQGALVTEVFEGDPADEAGIKAKDIILSVNGRDVKDSRALSSIIADLPVGKKVVIHALRDGKKKRFKVKIAKRPDDNITQAQAAGKTENELGIHVVELTRENAGKFDVSEIKGVVVNQVEPGGKGFEAGVLVGDIIKEINHHTITDRTDYKEAIKRVKKGESINMFIKRRNMGFVVIKIER